MFARLNQSNEIPQLDLKIKSAKVDTIRRKLRPGYRFNAEGLLEKLVNGMWVSYQSEYAKAHCRRA